MKRRLLPRPSCNEQAAMRRSRDFTVALYGPSRRSNVFYKVLARCKSGLQHFLWLSPQLKHIPFIFPTYHTAGPWKPGGGMV